MGGDDHLVAGADPGRLEGERERGRAGRDPHAVLGSAVFGELVLERRDLLAEDEGARPDDPFEGFAELRPDRLVLAVEGYERDAVAHSRQA